MLLRDLHFRATVKIPKIKHTYTCANKLLCKTFHCFKHQNSPTMAVFSLLFISSHQLFLFVIFLSLLGLKLCKEAPPPPPSLFCRQVYFLPRKESDKLLDENFFFLTLYKNIKFRSKDFFFF